MVRSIRCALMLVLFFTGAGCLTTRQPPLKVLVEKDEDSVLITPKSKATILTVTSKTGIGGATIVRGGEQWPPCIVIRLKLNSLESFGMSNGQISFDTSYKSPSRVPYWKVGDKSSPQGTFEVKIERKRDFLQLVVPKEMLQSDATVSRGSRCVWMIFASGKVASSAPRCSRWKGVFPIQRPLCCQRSTWIMAR